MGLRENKYLNQLRRHSSVKSCQTQQSEEDEDVLGQSCKDSVQTQMNMDVLINNV